MYCPAVLYSRYIDLLLLHWPAVSGVKSESERQASFRNVSWAAMRSLAAGEVEGVECRAIGVSNYLVKHLDGLMRCKWDTDAIVSCGT
jgi:diketogulonate reductase-like aldo/keto reductase